jgi:group I intron endonuclease
MLIYKITNKITGKTYVGQTSKTIQERFRAHLKKARKKVNRRLYDSMNHHGYDNFIIEEIEKVSDSIMADDREKFWIKELDSIMPNGYNMTDGGEGGNTLKYWSDEERAALYKQQGDARRGPRTQEYKDLMASLPPWDVNKTPEEKKEISKKISGTRKERIKNGDIQITMPPPKYGKDNFNHVEVDVDEVVKLIKLQWKMKDIAQKFDTTKNTIGAKLKKETGKTFVDWRREFGIRGAFGSMKRIDEDQT